MVVNVSFCYLIQVLELLGNTKKFIANTESFLLIKQIIIKQLYLFYLTLFKHFYVY